MDEQTYKEWFRRELLRFLLQKYEDSKGFLAGKPSIRRPQFSMDGNHPFVEDFNDEMDYRKREWLLEVIYELEQEGFIATIRDKYEFFKVKKIYLELERVAGAYELAAIVPLEEKFADMKKILSPLLEHKWEWMAQWAEKAIHSFSLKKAAGINVDEPDPYRDAVIVLRALTELEGNSPIRILSNQLFNDSKHFERRVANTLTSILKKASPIEFENDEEMLAFYGMVRMGKDVKLCGELSWSTYEGRHLTIEGFAGGVGLSDLTVAAIDEITLNAECLILIENLTSYEQWIHQRADAKELVIYTGGYPHKTLQTLLAKISQSIDISPIPVYHWGDIDIGGILIFEYLKVRFFHELQPLLMDIATLKRYKKRAIPLTATNKKTINRMLAEERYTYWHSLLQVLLEQDLKLEQESMHSVERVLIKNGYLCEKHFG